MRLMPGRAALAAAALSAATALAGCGSTLPLSEQQALTGQASGVSSAGSSASGGAGLGGINDTTPAGGVDASAPTGSSPGTASAASSSVAGATTATGSGGGGSTVGGVAGTQGTSGPASSGGSAAGGGSDATGNGPGVTASTVYIGMDYDPDAEAEDSALGAAGLNPGDVQAEYNAMASYINSHGGLDGRKAALVWADVSSTGNIQQQEQSACDTWTVDNKVFVMPAGVSIWDQCVADAHAVGLIDGDIAGETEPIMQRYPADFNLSGLTLDRAARYTIEGLDQQGYFARGAKIGIVTWDGSDFQYAAGQAVQQLAAMGIANVPVEYVSEPQSYGDISTSSSDVSSAILKFRSEGVDHVLLFDGTAGVFSGGGLTLLFMNAAGSQDYHPEYGLNSTSGLSSIVSDVPASEIANSMAIGWLPSLDLDSADYAALPESTNAKTCLQVMADAGQNVSGANAEANAFAVCDFFFFLQDALNRVRGPLDQASAIAAVESIGTAYPSILTFEDDFTAAQHDGVELVRNAAYYGSCSCFRYTSPAYNPG